MNQHPWKPPGLTPRQIAARRKGIGGSDAGAIVAGGEDWVKLGRQKLGLDPPDDLSDVLRVLMGQVTEPFNCWWYERRTGRPVARQGERVQHPTIPYLIGTLDGVTTTQGGPDWPAGERCYLDFKHLGRAGEEAHLRYTAAGHHYAAILDVDYWALSCFIGNGKWEYFEQPVDMFGFLDEYLELCKEFWSYIQAGQVPPARDPLPVPRPQPMLRTVHLEDDVDVWPNWGVPMVEALEAFAGTLAAHQKHEISKRTVKDLLPEDVGLVTRGRVKAMRDKGGAVRISMKGQDNG
jgi:hypothetical protein